MNNTPLPICSKVKYPSLILDKKLIRNPYLKDKRKALNARFKFSKTPIEIQNEYQQVTNVHALMPGHPPGSR